MSPISRKAKPFQNGKFWTLFESTPKLAATVVVDGLLTVTTEEFCKLFGYNADELNGMHFRLITDPLDYDTDDKLYQSLLAGEREFYTLVKRYVPKRGLQPFDAILTVAALRDDVTNDLVAAVSVIRPLPVCSIPEAIKTTEDPEQLKEYANKIIKHTELVAVHVDEAEKVQPVFEEDKRPLLSRVGDWVLRLVEAIKGLNVAQALLLAFLATLTFLGFLAWFHLAQVLEILSK